MALKQDQRAMLQLLLERGQAYEDLAGLLGLSVEEVRARARETLRELGGRDPDRNVGMTDFLLGQADPIGRADVVRELQNDGDELDLAEDLVAKLAVIAPGAKLPELPAGKGRKRGPVETGGAGVSLPRVSLPQLKRPSSISSRHQGRVIAALGSSALLVVVVVLAIAGVFSGGNSGAGSAATTSQSATNNENLTRIALLPTAGQKAAGQAIFARAGDQPFLQITLTGLSGSVPQGKVYVPWLYIKRSQAFPVGILRVDKSGNATGQVAIPQQVVSLLPTFKSLVVSLSDAKVVSADLRGASQKGNFPSFSGQEILVGKIPGR